MSHGFSKANTLLDTLDNSIADGRLTLTTAVPVTTSDVTGATTIYYTPYIGNRVALYDGNKWDVYTFSEISLALGTLTSGKNYDVFLYNNAGTLTLELSAAWTSDTARADAIALQDGIYVKSGTTTRRLIGTIRTTSTTQTEDSILKRFVWNYQNRIRREMRAIDTTNTWTYTLTTFRSANASDANRLQLVIGLDEDTVYARVIVGHAQSVEGNRGAVGVGLDSTSAKSNQIASGFGALTGTAFPYEAVYEGHIGIGFHFLQWIERIVDTGTSTWTGDNGVANERQSGIYGFMMG